MQTWKVEEVKGVKGSEQRDSADPECLPKGHRRVGGNAGVISLLHPTAFEGGASNITEAVYFVLTSL